jgi:rare lipoprotein A
MTLSIQSESALPMLKSLLILLTATLLSACATGGLRTDPAPADGTDPRPEASRSGHPVEGAPAPSPTGQVQTSPSPGALPSTSVPPQAGAASGGRPGATNPRGGYYMDDGPAAERGPDPATVPDPVPRAEPLLARANRPYVVFGQSYQPMTRREPFKQTGRASWYGRKFHGQKTSSGEIYDMHAMTAAHPTLPIPSYAKVTNLNNGRSVVVRVNDRGPFLHQRVIDLSYTAASKLGYVQAGSAPVEVELIDPDPSRDAPVQVAARAASEPVREERLQVETSVRPEVASTPDSSIRRGLDSATKTLRQVYLQMAAFAARDNAESARGRWGRQLAWLTRPLEVLAEATLFKVQLGPFNSQDEANAMADRILASTGSRPMLVMR